jgi:hypothetical protein
MQTTVNYCRKTVDKHVNFTFKKGFKTTIPDDPATPENENEDREFIRVMLDETWRRNNKLLWCLEAGQQGSVTGDLFARVSWETDDPLEDPYARVDIIPSHMCYPEFGGPHGVDRKKIQRMLIVSPVYKENEPISLDGKYFRRNAKTMSPFTLVNRAEEWTSPVIEKGQVIKKSKVIFYEDGRVIEEKENVFGEIPIVHIPNYPLSGEYYGISDIVDVIDLNRSMNEKLTDIDDIISYHAAPVTIIYGAKLADLERGVNKIWGLPADAKAENLNLEGDLAAARAHVERLRQQVLEMGDVPEIALGEKVAVSNTAGVALQQQYLPLLEKRDVKVLMYGHGLRLINRLIIKMTAMADSAFDEKLKKLKGNIYRNDVQFPDPLPQDVRRQLEIDREELDLGLNTRKRILETRGMSQTEATTLLDDVLEEKKQNAELMFAPESGPGSGTRTFERGGSQETKGEKITETVANKRQE